MPSPKGQTVLIMPVNKQHTYHLQTPPKGTFQ
jgi:hypothetical protein